MNVLANLAGFSILLLTPYYLVNVLKLSALESGFVLALSFAGGLTGAPLSARLVPVLGRRTTAFLGIVVVGAGLLPLAFTDGPYTVLYWSSDTAGNVEAQHSLSVNVDQTPPTITPTIRTISIGLRPIE